jgi:hypothetical protein
MHARRGVAFGLAMAIGVAGVWLEARWQRPAAPAQIRIVPDTQAEPLPLPGGAPAARPAEAIAIHDDTGSDRPGADRAFHGDDAALLRRLREQPIVRTKKGSGGRTLAFKLRLADGTQGYFKPEQSVSSASWYAELAAYHLDRALGLGRVPVVVGRRVRWSALATAAEGDRRVPEIKLDADGFVRGALVHWVDARLTPAVTPPGWESWLRVEPFSRTAVSPYQRPAVYASQLAELRALARAGQHAPARYRTPPALRDPQLAAALSDMIVFDLLTLNYDRFGNDNTNVLTLGPNGALIFLDNGDGFSPGPARRALLDARLLPLQRFRRRTVNALRALDVSALAARMRDAPHGTSLGAPLDARALEGLQHRRQAVLEHVAAQAARFGDSIYAW